MIERWLDKLQDAEESAASSFERTGERASKTAERIRRQTGSGVKRAGRQARERAEASRDALSERVESIARRARKLREERAREREARAERRRASRRRRSIHREPLQLDIRDHDRITLHGRRSVNVRTPDGGVIRYRFYESPGLARRIYLHTTGRQLWPLD